MNIHLSLLDFASISPFLILLGAALVLLLLESFAASFARKASFLLVITALIAAGCASYWSPGSSHFLLTPWLRFDPLARFFTLLFLAVGLGSVLLTPPFFERFTRERSEYYFLLLSALFGLILIGAAADFLILFLGIETLSISLYVLCCYMKKWEISQEAAIKYLLIGSVAAAFLLYGIALIYGAVGTLQLDQLLGAYRSFPSGSSQASLFSIGIALVTLGLAFKAAIVPFHFWAPDVYSGAPTPVTAFMAVGTKIGAFAAFIRVFFVALPQFEPLWNEGISFLVYPTLIYANFVAMRQFQLRRFFAYSGISHAGFALIPLVAGTPDALIALVFYLIIYALGTLGAFAVLAFLDQQKEGVTLVDLRGLFYRAPVLALIFAFCLLTLAGIPPSVGFFAKFYLFKVAFQSGYYNLVIIGLLTAVLAAYYYVRIIAVMFLRCPENAAGLPYSGSPAVMSFVSFFALLLLSFLPGSLITILAQSCCR